MDGLSLPDVVKHLLKESGILRWDPHEGTYEVLHGEKFESRSVLVFLLSVPQEVLTENNSISLQVQ